MGRFKPEQLSFISCKWGGRSLTYHNTYSSSVALSGLVKNIKVASSGFIKDKKIFKDFTSWQEGYGAFTYSIKEKDKLIEYVKYQEEHHKTTTFREEYMDLLKQHDIEFDEKYLW